MVAGCILSTSRSARPAAPQPNQTSRLERLLAAHEEGERQRLLAAQMMREAETGERVAGQGRQGRELWQP